MSVNVQATRCPFLFFFFFFFVFFFFFGGGGGGGGGGVRVHSAHGTMQFVDHKLARIHA